MKRVEITLSVGELTEIDSWREELGIEDREEAIRRLIKLGLKSVQDAAGEEAIIAT